MIEEIIIDGVDVSECVSFDKLNGLNICCYDDTREDKIPFANFCIENKDCYFKQLKRKEQECEKFKNFVAGLMFDTDCINWFERFVFAFEDWKAEICKDRDKYKQALDEIERIANSWYYNAWFCLNCRINMDKKLKKILDIIHNAKDGE